MNTHDNLPRNFPGSDEVVADRFVNIIPPVYLKKKYKLQSIMILSANGSVTTGALMYMNT